MINYLTAESIAEESKAWDGFTWGKILPLILSAYLMCSLVCTIIRAVKNYPIKKNKGPLFGLLFPIGILICLICPFYTEPQEQNNSDGMYR